MVNCSNLLVKLKNRLHRFHRLVQPYLNCDYDRCLDLILIGARVRPLTGVELWKRKCLTLYRLLAFYQFTMAVAKFGFNFRNRNDLDGLFSSFAIVSAMATVYVKVLVFGHYDEVVQQSKEFVKSHHSQSGDTDYDAKVRLDSTRMTGKVAWTIFGIICCDQVIVSVPTSVRDSIFGIPEELHVLGIWAARLLQQMFVFLSAFIWAGGSICTSVTVIPLLVGLRSELIIIARGYETIEEQWKDRRDRLNMKETPRSDLNWTNSREILGTTIEQHVEVMRNIHLMQPFVSHSYAIAYYSIMLIASLMVLMVIRNGLSLISLMLTMTATVFLLECYLWSRIISSMEESMEMIANSVAMLGSKLPHSMDHHSEFVEMRTSLMIVQLNASQSDWFRCGDIFPISVESFGDLCMIIYRFTTFLLSFV